MNTPPLKRGIKRKLDTSGEKKMKQPSILNFFHSPENKKDGSKTGYSSIPENCDNNILNVKNFNQNFKIKHEITIELNYSDVESTVSDVTSNSLESCKENRKRTQRHRKSINDSLKDFIFAEDKDSENFTPPKKKRRTGPGSYEVENVVDYSIIRGTLHFNVKWVGYSSKENTWEPFSNVKDCEPFERYFEREYELRQEKLESLKVGLYEQLEEEISAMKEKQKEEIMKLLRENFNDVEFKCNFMLYAFLENERGERKFKKWFMNQMVLYYMFEMQEAQHAKYNEFLKNIRLLEPDCTIRIENNVDFLGPPENFTYVNENMPMAGIEIPNDPPIGCDCIGEEGCSRQSSKCCPTGMNSHFAYELSGSGGKKLRLERRQPIYECNSLCKCGPDCLNRVVQNGIRTPMCLFKTKNRGWGVKSVHRIFKGTFICEYMGEIINNEEAEKRGQEYDNIGRNYLFDLDYDRDVEEVFTIDAFKFGNMARFINHSCDPNCVIWPVFHNCLDNRFPRLAFFTTRRIEEGEELSIDYAGGVVRDSDATREVSEFEQCRCGSEKCRKFIFNR